MGDDKGASSMIGIGIGLLILVIIISAVMFVLNTGRNLFSTGSDSLTSSLAKLSSTEYDIYDNSTQMGSGVISLINSTYKDKTIEILVCTKDGTNNVYVTDGADIYGATDGVLDWNESSNTYLTGMVATDAQGNSFVAGAATVKAVAYSNDGSTLMSSAGYNTNADINTAGYISSSAYFSCTVQKDINGDVRRVTCVQQ